MMLKTATTRRLTYLVEIDLVLGFELQAVERVRIDGIIASTQAGEYQHQHAPLHRSRRTPGQLIKRDPRNPNYKGQLIQRIPASRARGEDFHSQLLSRDGSFLSSSFDALLRCSTTFATRSKPRTSPSIDAQLSQTLESEVRVSGVHDDEAPTTRIPPQSNDTASLGSSITARSRRPCDTITAESIEVSALLFRRQCSSVLAFPCRSTDDAQAI